MIENNDSRIGNFTSSEIAALMSVAKDGNSFGKPALSYIIDKIRERRLGRSLKTHFDSRYTLWGKCCEQIAFNKLGTNYKLSSQETIRHPNIPYWVGSPDGVAFDNDGNIDTVFDIKCPFTLSSFCEFFDCQTIDEVRKNHPDGENYYYQIVSNSILTGATHGELIFYMPYRTELEEVRGHSVDIEFTRMKNEYAWIFHAMENELPYLLNGGHYENLSIISWVVSPDDKNRLTEAVIRAGEMLEAGKIIVVPPVVAIKKVDKKIGNAGEPKKKSKKKSKKKKK